jgi:hypothetical protein
VFSVDVVVLASCALARDNYYYYYCCCCCFRRVPPSLRHRPIDFATFASLLLTRTRSVKQVSNGYVDNQYTITLYIPDDSAKRNKMHLYGTSNQEICSYTYNIHQFFKNFTVLTTIFFRKFHQVQKIKNKNLECRFISGISEKILRQKRFCLN